MISIEECYRRWNFSDKERQKFRQFDKLQIKIEKQQEKHRKKLELYNDKLQLLSHEKSELWSKASKMQDRLQKRCKHNGGTYTQQIYRDFGSDVIRTHCRLCQVKLSSRSKDD